MKQRFVALRQRMAATRTGLIAIAPGSHMVWLLGFNPHPDERPCLLLVGPEKEAMLMPTLNVEGSRNLTDVMFYSWADDEGLDAALRAALAAVAAEAPGLIALDETMRADFALLLIDALPADTRRTFTQATLGGLRMRKDASEYTKLKMNAGISDRAIQEGDAVVIDIGGRKQAFPSDNTRMAIVGTITQPFHGRSLL